MSGAKAGLDRGPHPGTTWPLFSVRQRYSLMWSCVMSFPMSFIMDSCHLRTSWLARLVGIQGHSRSRDRGEEAHTRAEDRRGRTEPPSKKYMGRIMSSQPSLRAAR